MSPKPTVENLDGRVAELETWKGEVVAQLSQTEASLKTLTVAVGERPSDDDPAGSGMAADIALLASTVGKEPSQLHGTAGSGMAKLVYDLHTAAFTRSKFWPGVLDKVRNVTAILTFVVVCATVISGCAAGATYLIRLTVHNTGSVLAGKP